jgi:hypothetical protein
MRLLVLILAALLVLQGAIARADNWQTPGEIQQPKGPWMQKAIQQPRGLWLTPGAIQTPKAATTTTSAWASAVSPACATG